MAKKYKMTGCARFMIFLLVLVPAVYFGVNYFRGENGMDNLKKGYNDVKEKVVLPSKESSVTDEALYEGRIKTLENKVDELTKKNDRLEEILEAREAEIKSLKGQ